VVDGFEPNQFSADFTSANEQLKSAIGALEVCGIRVPMPEGFGYFLGRRDSRRDTAHLAWSYPGDGHTALQINELGSSEDDAFSFKLTYIKDGTQSGCVTHYAPKHRPLTEELRSIFEFLKLREFEGCPEFSFEKCHWLFLLVGSDSQFVEDQAAALAHTQFYANANKFSSGIEGLLAANTNMSPHGMAFLPVSSPIAAAQKSIAQVIRVVNSPTKAGATVATEFDIVISFAGTDRAKAEELAERLRDAGVRVFYDSFYPEMLWGKDLAVFFADIFRRSAKYCVIFASREYNDRMWTTHERVHATARALEERGGEYILPIKVEDVEIPGISPTIGYVSLTDRSIADIASMLIKKLAM